MIPPLSIGRGLPIADKKKEPKVYIPKKDKKDDKPVASSGSIKLTV